MADSARRNGIAECLRIIEQRSRQDPYTGCMEWQGHTHKKGYGAIRCDGKMRKVHHLTYIAVNGPIPDGMHVLHECDNPSCCEPKHLTIGTNAQNIAEKMERDRSGKKLCIAQVVEIKRMLADGELHRVIAARFGVVQSSISKIATGERWWHVSTPSHAMHS